MNCPVCETELRPTDRQGIEIDYCPQCRGVWLDRGELDKIVERSNSYYGGERDRDHDRDDYRERQREHSHGYGHSHDPRHKKKKGFLGDFFDFD